MPLLRDAILAIQRNLYALFIYLVAAVAVSCVGAGWQLLTDWHAIRPHPAAVEWGALALGLAVTGWVAAVQCLVFTRIAHNVDHPLWNVRDDRVALDRFFWLWFVFGIAALAAEYLAGFMAESFESDGGVLFFVFAYVGILVLTVPIGAAIMFQGVTDTVRLGEALAPLGRQLPVTLLICVMNYIPVLLFLQVPVIGDNPLGRFVALTLVNIVSVYVDCVAFAAVFMICMADRDSSEERDLDL